MAIVISWADKADRNKDDPIVYGPFPSLAKWLPHGPCET